MRKLEDIEIALQRYMYKCQCNCIPGWEKFKERPNKI